MEASSDTYQTLSIPSEEVLYKEKKSKFFSYAFPIEHEDEVKPIVEILKKKHPTAGHVCYAWQLGIENIRYRANDDGEPNNSAGLPIYGQIQAFEVTNVLIAVVRIFGGTKLGVGGLISAYRMAAQLALQNSKIVAKILTSQFEISFAYANMDKVMRIIKQRHYEIISQQMQFDCKMIISVRKTEVVHFNSHFQGLHKVMVKQIR